MPLLFYVFYRWLYLNSQLTFFETSLPVRPYATDNFNNGLYQIPKANAIKSRYIQHNGPTHKRWLVFDVDRPGGGIDWRNELVPAPNIVCENKKNYHAHLIYGLEIPVRVNAPDAKVKPIRYAAAIENGLLKKLDADPNYSGLICKNPLSDYWQVSTYEPYLYTLDLLKDYIDFEPYQDKRKHLPDYGLGRNCTLFENLSKWAYRARLHTWDKSFSYWTEIVFRQAQDYNTKFQNPLPFTEVKATAKSISKWVWQNFTQAEFSRIQAIRGAKLNAQRRRERANRQQLVFWYKQVNPDATKREMAKEFGVKERTIQNYLNPKGGEQDTISDNRL